jgi:hypothetical protein
MKLFLTLLIVFQINLYAHEGGHGNIKEGGKFGGITAPVFLDKEMKNPSTAKLQYKAELVRTASGKLSLYLFDDKMNRLDPKDFSDPKANLEVKKKGKFVYVSDFTFKKSKTHFSAQLPKIEYKPFNIDVRFTRDGKTYFIGFSNLD